MTEATYDVADPESHYGWSQKALAERKAECPEPPHTCEVPKFVAECAGSNLYHKPHSARLVYMKPRTFLCASHSIREKITYKEESLPRLVNRMAACLPIDIPFLDVDVRTGNVLTHEGRHRALAAAMLGIERIPVVLFHREGFKKDRPWDMQAVDPDSQWQEAVLEPKDRFRPFVQNQRLVRRLKSEYDKPAGQKQRICVE